ncbi:MAG TPA: HWE histidine kinase domain-containing protein [Caulobacteraceae bacterium]|jgi:PAS domain S-box-containing protein
MTLSRPPLHLAISEPEERPGRGDQAQALLDGLPDAIHVVDHDWRLTYANAAFLRHMGMDKDHVIGSSLWDLIPWARGDRLREAHAHVLANGQTDSFLHESVHYPDRTMDVRVFPLLDGVGIVLRDVTRRVTAERALATSEEHLRRALNGAEMGHWRWEAKSDRIFMSERTLALYGLGPEHQGLERTEVRRLTLHPDDVPRVKAAAEEAQVHHVQYEAEYRVRRDGQWRWMRVMAGPHVVDGQAVGMHGLVQDIHDRKLVNERLQAEIDERERAQQHQLLLIHELNHRVKNILAMVQSIATQTLSAADTPQDALLALDQRLLALARAHDVLTRESWNGAELTDIITGAVAPHEARPGLRVRTRGAPVRLAPKTAVSLAMVLHELATNAVKYGALSTDDGWVSLEWTAARAGGGLDLALTWAEHGGPPVAPPKRKGFGARLITYSLAAEQGEAQLIYAPEGLCCRMTLFTPHGAGVGQAAVPALD